MEQSRQLQSDGWGMNPKVLLAMFSALCSCKQTLQRADQTIFLGTSHRPGTTMREICLVGEFHASVALSRSDGEGRVTARVGRLNRHDGGFCAQRTSGRESFKARPEAYPRLGHIEVATIQAGSQ